MCLARLRSVVHPEVLLPEPRPRTTEREGGDDSPGVSSPTTHSNLTGPVHPGLPGPGTFRPQGLTYPLDGLLPVRSGTGSSTGAANMGFALQGLAPPDQRYPSRGLASLVVSPLPISRGRARLQRLTLVREGARKPLPKQRPPNLALLGFGPFRVFSCATLEPASRFEPLTPFRPEVLPTFPLPGEAPGD